MLLFQRTGVNSSQKVIFLSALKRGLYAFYCKHNLPQWFNKEVLSNCVSLFVGQIDLFSNQRWSSLSLRSDNQLCIMLQGPTLHILFPPLHLLISQLLQVNVVDIIDNHSVFFSCQSWVYSCNHHLLRSNLLTC